MISCLKNIFLVDMLCFSKNILLGNKLIQLLFFPKYG